MGPYYSGESMDLAKDFFDEWASFYDANYEDQEIGDVEFYVDLAAETDGPVLEVGCGTGRIYLELLRAGVDADGIDISAEMLDVLEQKADEAGLTPSVRQADMTDFVTSREYDLIIVPFRTFLHNVTVAEQKAALRQFRETLAPDGRLALNFFVPSFDMISQSYGEPQTRSVTYQGEEYIVTNISRLVDEVAQTVETERTIEYDGDVVRQATFQLALLSKSEFELLLETTGWSDWTGYGGFDRQPLKDGAEEMVWVAEK
ncbi:tRNA 5-carboxymethoxyuridine methyltransferase [Haloarcula japonica]